MKHLKKLGYLLILAVAFSFTACEEDSELLIIDSSNSEIEFTNSFLSEYILTFETSSNLGERFTWNSPDFELPTAITYDLQKSLTGDFSDYEVAGSTGGNEIAITIGDMLDYANALGLDNDPATEAPDSGTVSFRVRAYSGVDGVEVYSDAVALTLFLPEVVTGDDAVCEFDLLYGVGDGLTDAGWSWDHPVQVMCTGNGVYSGNVALQNLDGAFQNFRFFTANSDWASGLNYPHFANAGYTIDDRFEGADPADDSDENFLFVGTTGYYYLEIDTMNKTITLSDPQAIGVCEFDVLYGVGDGLTDAGWSWDHPVELWCNSDGVYSRTVNLQNLDGTFNNFRFFTANSDWASGRNYPYFANEGYTIDDRFEGADPADDSDENFLFIGTTGSYLLTIDTMAKTITLE